MNRGACWAADNKVPESDMTGQLSPQQKHILTPAGKQVSRHGPGSVRSQGQSPKGQVMGRSVTGNSYPLPVPQTKPIIW